MKTISFEVLGTAQPKGSTSAFIQQDKAGRMHSRVTSANPQLKAWQMAVAWQALISVRDAGLFTGPVALSLSFHLPRPRSLAKTITCHTRKPDLDKLIRAVKDGLTGACYHDDAQVVCIVAFKHYAPLCDPPYVRITVSDYSDLLKEGIHGTSTEPGQQQPRSSEHHGRTGSQTIPPDTPHGNQSGEVGQEDH